LFTLKIQNANGEVFELTHNSKNYNVVSVQGLTRPPTAVNTSEGGNIDGSFWNSSRVEQRNIVIDVVIRGDIAANRQRLYKIFSLKKPCTIFFKCKNRDVKIIGYVEILDGDLFVLGEQIQISIICPRPYFEALDAIYTELSQIVRMFEFPFSIAETEPIPFSEIEEYPLCTITNSGDVETGCIITVEFSGFVEGLTIYNTTNQTFFGLNYSFSAGDTLTISTVQGQKFIKLLRDGITSNLLNYMTAGSTWFTVGVGDNDFTFTTTTGADAVRVTFATADLFGGV